MTSRTLPCGCRLNHRGFLIRQCHTADELLHAAISEKDKGLGKELGREYDAHIKAVENAAQTICLTCGCSKVGDHVLTRCPEIYRLCQEEQAARAKGDEKTLARLRQEYQDHWKGEKREDSLRAS
jgi:hypothetical protein